MNRKLFLSFILIFSSFASFSQLSNRGNQVIRGRVTEQGTKETLPGVNVVIEGLNLGSSTDIDGNFEIRNVPAGAHKIVVSYIGYETITRIVEVKPGMNLLENFVMKEESAMLGEVTVAAARVTGNESSVVLEVKEAGQVVSGISKQQIANSTDGNAAQAMTRVPGITITEGRFIMIRGLNERYNNVLINNVIAPSTEVDKRTFAFDLIPTGALDRMMIYKSGAPENPGDFAGGIIKIYTNNTVEQPFTQIQIGTAYRNNTTFKPYQQSQGSSTDFLGFDNGFRSIPSVFPSTDEMIDASRTSQLRENAGRSLTNNYVPIEANAMPDMSVGFAMGRNFKLFGRNASNVTAVNYSQSFQFMDRDFYRYFEYDSVLEPGIVRDRFRYDDEIFEKENKISVLSNFSISLSPRAKLQFSNLFNQIGQNETNIRRGQDFVQLTGNDRENFLLGYRSRSIYLSQLNYDIAINDQNELHAALGLSLFNENEPDLRRFRTFFAKPEGAEDRERIMIDPPSSNLFDASRYFGSLNEYIVNGGVDYTYTVKSTKKEKTKIKAGAYGDYKNRSFDSRYMSFLIPGGISPDRREELVRLPLDEIFAGDNVSRSNGWILEEGTRPQDSYFAENILMATYAGISIPFRRWNVNGGARFEYNIQRLFSQTDTEDINVDNPIPSFLPFVNFSYYLNEKSQLRLGYGRTVNRPEFRELAPFLFYDFKLDANRVGQPNLEVATIDNVDLRYEYYPRLGEVFSLGAFFKYFDKPIENRNIITSELPQFSYINADYARNYGVEFEFRKSLKGVVSTPILRRLNFNLNASYIFSEVDLGEIASAENRRVRPLQGQSPYIINFITGYNHEPYKLMASIAYNVFGKRIFAVGDLNNPDIYELPRHSLDFTLSKSFETFTIKAGIQDILNYVYRFYQDTERNGGIDLRQDDSLDRPIFTFRRGTLFSLDLSFDLERRK